jgi:hypothetical protein
VQPIQSTPIEALPGPSSIVPRQPQQPENGVVDLVSVDLYGGNLPDPGQPCRGPERVVTTQACQPWMLPAQIEPSVRREPRLWSAPKVEPGGEAVTVQIRFAAREL